MIGLDPIIDEAKPVCEREEALIAGNIIAFIDAVQNSNRAVAKVAFIPKVAVSLTMSPGVKIDLAAEA